MNRVLCRRGIIPSWLAQYIDAQIAAECRFHVLRLRTEQARARIEQIMATWPERAAS